jgi:hypothetical protein
MFAMILESPFPDEMNEKLSPVGEILGRGTTRLAKGCFPGCRAQHAAPLLDKAAPTGAIFAGLLDKSFDSGEKSQLELDAGAEDGEEFG